MNERGISVPVIGAVIVFLIVEAYLFIIAPAMKASGNGISIESLMASGFVNEIVLPGVALIVIGFIMLNKFASKRGISLPWSK